MNIDSLKREWLERWMPDVMVHVDCFFCEYADEHFDHQYRFCSQCPGRLVGKRFNCRNAAYNYREEPKKFYQKLLQLDAKRRQK